MTFLHPEFLYYMLPPLFLLFGLLLTQKESHEHYFSQEVMEKLRVNSNTLTLKARNRLFFLVAFFAILALAQPVIKDGASEIKTKSSDIMIALDISDSMLASDVYPNRLELAKQKALMLLGDAVGERVGVIAFAKNAYLVSPLSFDTTAVSFLLHGLDTTSITEQGTDFLSLIGIAGEAEEGKERKNLLILSDGGDKHEFSDEIELAKKSGIVVYVLGIATKKGAPVKLKDGSLLKKDGEVLISRLNESVAELATKTGGVYIQGTTASDDIKAMLREIKSASSERELESEKVQRYIQLFYYPIGLALFVLLIATSSISRRGNNSASILFLLFTLVFGHTDAKAGLFDFMKLNEAKSSYEKKDYKNSARLYEEYAKTNQNSEAYYNSANSYYKQKKYKEAIENYKKASFDSRTTKSKNLSNLGNAYAKSNELIKAVESYEESLKNQEDKDTRENLEEVRKLIQEQKNDSKENQKNSDDSKKSEQTDKKNQPDKNDKPKGESQNKDDLKKSEQEKNEQKKSDSGEQKDKKESAGKKENSAKNDNNNSSAQSNKKAKMMSDEEQDKWMQEINRRKGSFLYRLNDKETKKGNSGELPW